MEDRNRPELIARTDDARLIAALQRLDPAARDELRQPRIHDQPDRDAIAEQLLKRRASGADAIGDLVDLLSLDAIARRTVVRLLGEWGLGLID